MLLGIRVQRGSNTLTSGRNSTSAQTRRTVAVAAAVQAQILVVVGAFVTNRSITVSHAQVFHTQEIGTPSASTTRPSPSQRRPETPVITLQGMPAASIADFMNRA